MDGSVLVVAAHPDDEVLGCGGTIARMSREGRKVHILFVADGESSRSTESNGKNIQKLDDRLSDAKRACQILGCASVHSEQLPDNRLDGVELLRIVQIIERHIERYKPSTVFTHCFGDVNVDHKIVHEAVLAACRPQPGHYVKELIFFEIPSSTEWRVANSSTGFSPSLFVDITETLSIKLKAIKAYTTELRHFPHPRSLKAIEALATWRGATAGLSAAESFVIGRKIL
ncbi:MAG: PIG-L family deacetylase [Proteobacteria bacterium]|nr:PIG-L family deacetylase [Pseudomonadota bacterium]